jgi:hypothetical protein
MFEKTKSNIKSFLQHQKNDPESPKLETTWKQSFAGLSILFIFLFLSYSLGRSDGRQSEIDQIPELQAVQSHLMEVEKACQLRFDTPKVESQVVGAAK